MQRKLKFKAWDKWNKRMILNLYPKDFHKRVPSNVDDCWILMQYTNINDRKGNLIYESDIIKCHYFYQALGDGLGVTEAEHELIGIVKWGNYGWGLEAIKGEHWCGYTGYNDGEGECDFMDLCQFGGIHEESFEVIGNIYQNPELIQSL